MTINPGSTILFQGDSITDAGRKRDFGDVAIPASMAIENENRNMIMEGARSEATLGIR